MDARVLSTVYSEELLQVSADYNLIDIVVDSGGDGEKGHDRRDTEVVGVEIVPIGEINVESDDRCHADNNSSDNSDGYNSYNDDDYGNNDDDYDDDDDDDNDDDDYDDDDDYTDDGLYIEADNEPSKGPYELPISVLDYRPNNVVAKSSLGQAVRTQCAALNLAALYVKATKLCPSNIILFHE